MNNVARAKLFVVVMSTVLVIASALHAKQTGQPAAQQTTPPQGE